MLKLLQISLLYNCFIALVHCNITHNTERKNTFDMWNHKNSLQYQHCCVTYFGLHIVFCTYCHTEDTQLGYCIVELVNMDVPETRTHHGSALCCFVYSPRMWLLSLRAAVLPTQNWAAAPASSLQTFDCWGEVRGSDSVQCVKWRQWQRTSQEKTSERSNFKRSFGIFIGRRIILKSTKRVYNNCVRLIVLMKK